MVDRCSLVHEYIIPAPTRFPNEVDQLNALPKAKKVFPHLGEVPSQVLQQTIKQLHRSRYGFKEQGHGFARFKKFGQFKSLLFPQFKKSPLVRMFSGGSFPPKHCLGTHIELPKLGLTKINLHRPIPDGFEIKQVRIVRKADRWYANVSIQCDARECRGKFPPATPLVNVPDSRPHGHPIGVDVGLNSFLATSNGVIVRAPKFFKDLQSKLKLLQRRLSRKQKRSNNYEKQRIKVALTHHRIDNTRKDFHFKHAHALCDSAGMVFFEDLDYRILSKGMLGKSMLDAGFGQFRNIVKYVCAKRDKFFAEVNSRGTSQECPECGADVKKNLSDRVHLCPDCKYQTDRDVASGQVIRRGRTLSSTGGQPGLESVCAADLPGTGVTQSRQLGSNLQKRKNQKN